MKTTHMKVYIPLLIILIAIFTSCSPSKQKDPDALYFAKADSLLKLLTLEEKAGQMTNIGLTALTQGEFWTTADTLELDTVKMRNLLINYGVGSVQNKGKYPPSLEEWNRLVRSIQEYVIGNTRHKIPILFGIDGVHGATYTAGSTIFPHQLALAATWNPEFARITGEVTAYELRASGIPWNYAPALDVSMQPLWGRLAETFGEDTYINTVFGTAYVEGSQGSSISNPTSAVVCLKHFLGYGTPNSGKDRSPVLIPEHYLRQYYLEPFRRAIESGALTVMLNSGSVNGIPGHIDGYLVNSVLKGELGLKGFVITDWGDISRLVEVHRVAKNQREATKMALLAGVDMCMVPYDVSFAADVVDLVNAGEVPISRIDDAVRRILYVKYKMGLIQNPWTNPADYPKFGSPQFAEKSYQAALEAITLLKNKESVLPLSPGSVNKILVTGPTANSITALNGPWSRTFKGDDPTYDDSDKQTFLQAMVDKFGERNVLFDPGTDFDGAFAASQSLMRKASQADVIFVCLGERPATEKFSDIHSLDLPANQLQLVTELHKSGKPIVVILLQGRPRVIRQIEPLAEAVILAYWPGHEGGRALATIISGQDNPSGKLPITYPRYSNTLHTYQHKGSDKFDEHFGMNGFNPQWEFGSGLSYSNFIFDSLSISADTISSGQELTVGVTVTNHGPYDGKEVVQLYLRDMVASITPDDRKLIGFQKIFLKVNQSQRVVFTVTQNDLKFVDTNNNWIAEDGDFEILIGGNPQTMQTFKFYYSSRN
jgi:beta-glucosidase